MRIATGVVVGALLLAGCTSSSGKASGKSSTTENGSTATPTTTRIAAPNSPVAVPTVAGPVTGGEPDVPVNAMPTEFAKQYGYAEKEYYFSGRATAYEADGEWGKDGKWSVKPTTTAAYKSRMVVRTPTDPKKFNGTVVVEWFNETAGRDADPDFGFAHAELIRDGFAYVGVSAQALGITGQGGFTIPIPGYHPVSLKIQNPARYSTLTHPGDDYSYDIFSQAAQAIWRPKGVNPLGSLHPSRLIATGESQSAARMVTYVNAISPISNLFGGFVIHSRGNDGAAINAASKDANPEVALIRTDISSPVMTTQTETDLFGLGFYPSRASPTPTSSERGRWPVPRTPTRARSTTASRRGRCGRRARRRPTSRSCVAVSTTGPRPTS